MSEVAQEGEDEFGAVGSTVIKKENERIHSSMKHSLFYKR